MFWSIISVNVPFDKIIVPPVIILSSASLKLVAFSGNSPLPLPPGVTKIILSLKTVTIYSRLLK